MSALSMGYWIDRLAASVRDVNEASEECKARGLSVNLGVNGIDYGDKVSLRIEGDDLAARAPLTSPQDGGE